MTELARFDPTPTAVGAWTAADRALSDDTVARLAESVPPATRRAYTRAWDRFARWCHTRGRAFLPATGETLTEYVNALVADDFAPATIEQTIGAIRSVHAMAGHRGCPDTTGAAKLLRLHKRVRAEHGITQRQAIPFTPDTLRQAVAALDLATLAGRRDQLVLVLGFTMMARRSELARLAVADVTETPDGLDVLVRLSKTDKQSQGHVRSLPPQSHPDVDPVRLHRAWVGELHARGQAAGPLLRRLQRDGEPGGGLAEGGVNDVVKRAARRAGLADAHRYTAHSLRAGGLTAALRAGVPLGIAARHGGWDPESPTPARYARAADRWKDNAMRGVL